MVCADDTTAAPLAAALLRQHLERAGVHAEVASAGIEATTEPVSRDIVSAALHWRIDLSLHVPREASPRVVTTDGADLIITMAREQLRRLVASDRRTWVRTFTLKELVRSVEGMAPVPGVPLDSWAAALIRRRRGVDLIDDDLADDLTDVRGRGIAAVSTLADQLHDLTAALVPSVPWS